MMGTSPRQDRYTTKMSCHWFLHPSSDYSAGAIIPNFQFNQFNQIVIAWSKLINPSPRRVISSPHTFICDQLNFQSTIPSAHFYNSIGIGWDRLGLDGTGMGLKWESASGLVQSSTGWSKLVKTCIDHCHHRRHERHRRRRPGWAELNKHLIRLMETWSSRWIFHGGTNRAKSDLSIPGRIIALAPNLDGAIGIIRQIRPFDS